MDKSLTDTSSDLIQLFIVSDPIEYILGKNCGCWTLNQMLLQWGRREFTWWNHQKSYEFKNRWFCWTIFFCLSVSPNMEGIMQFMITWALYMKSLLIISYQRYSKCWEGLKMNRDEPQTMGYLKLWHLIFLCYIYAYFLSTISRHCLPCLEKNYH